MPAELVRPEGDALSVAGRRTCRSSSSPVRCAAPSAPARSRAGPRRSSPGTRPRSSGPSGAGKSTALAVLGGLIKPASGTVTPDLPRRRQSRARPDVGWVPQNPEHGFLTTDRRDEVGRTGEVVERRSTSSAVLEVFGLGHLGARQSVPAVRRRAARLALAAALAHRPGVVLLDEPTVGQDRHTWAAVVGWIAAAARAGATVAVSTHDADLAASTSERRPSGVRA